jgi:4-amino-4-deoxy-L-arabinose transferase-like glycosyltransferase
MWTGNESVVTPPNSATNALRPVRTDVTLWMMNRIFGAAKSLWLIVLVALIARLYFVYDFEVGVPRQAVSTIPFLFEVGNIAHSLATGHGFGSPFRAATGPTAWMTPLFPALLACIFRVFGSYTFHAWLAVAIFNIFCCTAATIPVFLIGTRIGGKSVGAGAAWLWAIFPNAILLPVESMWDASLSALLAITILWATLALDDSGRIRNWCAYGLLWGVALMTNATLGALLPFLLGWLTYRAYKTDPRCLLKAAASVVVVILCCVPWTIRNYAVFHTFVPLRSVLGLQLWLGNNDHTQDIFRGDLHPIYNSQERAHYVDVGEIAYMHEKKDEAVRYMLAHPSREAHLVFRRFISIWAGGTPYPLADFVESSSWWFRYVVAFNLLAALGALGGIIILFWRRSIYAFPVAVFPVVYPCAFYLTLSLPRYRLPVDPVVMLLCALFVHQLFAKRTQQIRDAALSR